LYIVPNEPVLIFFSMRYFKFDCTNYNMGYR
jgi:hypothetical protein